MTPAVLPGMLAGGGRVRLRSDTTGWSLAAAGVLILLAGWAFGPRGWGLVLAGVGTGAVLAGAAVAILARRRPRG